MDITGWIKSGALLGFALAAACGGTVVSAQAGATGSGGTIGVGGATSTGAPSTVGVGGSATTCPCCNGGCSDATTSSSVSTGAGGGGAICGGLPGFLCPPDEYCEYPDKMCGGNDGEGTCFVRPQGCPANVDPTCGCDHQIYDNPCDAAEAGVDVSDLGGCTPPAGAFGCGSGFCNQDTEYCQIIPSGTSKGVTSYTCMPLPSSCGTAPTCGCLSGVACGGNCMTSNDGDGLEVICLTN